MLRTTIVLYFTCAIFCTVIAEDKINNKYAIASAHPLATLAGEEILQAGGNAFDAAVAISAALAVVEPFGSGIGGGGFWLLHDASLNEDIVIDGREVAPLAATKDMYLDADGNLTRDSIDGPLAAGIPGVVAALEHMSNEHGQLSLRQNLIPAISYARNGFKVGERYLKLTKLRKKALSQEQAASYIFLDNYEVPVPGYILRQPDLANSLSLIADQGAKVFYQGLLAKLLVKGTRQAGGVWSEKDLATYKIKIRKPIRTQFYGIDIIMPPPPTSGGVVITQILSMLESKELVDLSEVESIHRVVEAMRRAYQDRAIYLGDPAYIDIPMQKLLSKQYAINKFSDFNSSKASVSGKLADVTLKQGEDTTHFSVIDSEGNYVSATLSINYPFGSGFVVPGTGILLNDEMDDFSMREDVANVWGLVGSQANSIEPGKRMLSSMTPLFARDGQRTLIVGTPGGSRIISMLALAILKYQQGADAKQIVGQRRFHHQYLPDEIQFENNALSNLEQEALINKGHKLNQLSRQYGNMQAIIWNKQNNKVEAASDPRGEGLAIVQ